MLKPRGIIINRPQFSASFVNHAEESSGGTTITYGSLSFGAEHPNRIIAVFVAARMATVNTIVSVTIGGIPAILAQAAGVSSVAQVSGTNGSNCAIYYARVPWGTTGSVVVTYGAATSRTGIAFYRIISKHVGPVSVNAKASATTTSVALTVPPGGSGFAGGWVSTATATYSWSGATQDYTAVSGGTSQVSSATVTASQSALSSGVNNPQVVACATWGP